MHLLKPWNSYFLVHALSKNVYTLITVNTQAHNINKKYELYSSISRTRIIQDWEKRSWVVIWQWRSLRVCRVKWVTSLSPSSMLTRVDRIWHRRSEKRQITKSKKKTSSNLYQLRNNRLRRMPFNVQDVNRESVGTDRHKPGAQTNLWQWVNNLELEGSSLTVSVMTDICDMYTLWKSLEILLEKNPPPPYLLLSLLYLCLAAFSGRMRKKPRVLSIIYYQPSFLLFFLFCSCSSSLSLRFGFSQDNIRLFPG